VGVLVRTGSERAARGALVGRRWVYTVERAAAPAVHRRVSLYIAYNFIKS